MTKFIEVVSSGRRILVNVEKISQVYPGENNDAIIILNETEKDSLIYSSNNYNEVRDKIKNVLNQS
jgi:DNA-binding LytR/AlgR family response regulator